MRIYFEIISYRCVTAHKLTLLVFTVRSHLLPAGLDPASVAPSGTRKMGTASTVAGQVTYIHCKKL